MPPHRFAAAFLESAGKKPVRVAGLPSLRPAPAPTLSRPAMKLSGAGLLARDLPLRYRDSGMAVEACRRKLSNFRRNPYLPICYAAAKKRFAAAGRMVIIRPPLSLRRDFQRQRLGGGFHIDVLAGATLGSVICRKID